MTKDQYDPLTVTELSFTYRVQNEARDMSPTTGTVTIKLEIPNDGVNSNPVATAETKAGGSSRTSSRPTLNPRTESPRLHQCLPQALVMLISVRVLSLADLPPR